MAVVATLEMVASMVAEETLERQLELWVQSTIRYCTNRTPTTAWIHGDQSNSHTIGMKTFPNRKGPTLGLHGATNPSLGLIKPPLLTKTKPCFVCNNGSCRLMLGKPGLIGRLILTLDRRSTTESTDNSHQRNGLHTNRNLHTRPTTHSHHGFTRHVSLSPCQICAIQRILSRGLVDLDKSHNDPRPFLIFQYRLPEHHRLNYTQNLRHRLWRLWHHQDLELVLPFQRL